MKDGAGGDLLPGRRRRRRRSPRSPQLEGLPRARRRGAAADRSRRRVLARAAGRFDGHKLRSVTQAGDELDKLAAARASRRMRRPTSRALIVALKEALSDAVADVRATDRLVDSAVVLAAARARAGPADAAAAAPRRPRRRRPAGAGDQSAPSADRGPRRRAPRPAAIWQQTPHCCSIWRACRTASRPPIRQASCGASPRHSPPPDATARRRDPSPLAARAGFLHRQPRQLRRHTACGAGRAGRMAAADGSAADAFLRPRNAAARCARRPRGLPHSLAHAATTWPSSRTQRPPATPCCAR